MSLRQVNTTAYEATLHGGIVEIGDRKAVNFKPHLKLNRWGVECFIKVGLQTLENHLPTIEEDGKIKWFSERVDTYLYPLEPRTIIAKDKDGNDVPFTQNELGGFEFEIILKKKPTSNKIVLNIETQGLKFYYQPELTPEEIANGAVRPDNIVGSYAVYHATRTPFHKSKADAEKYKCGKAFHIYRPKITDAEGNWIWGGLSLDERAGTLTIVVPQDFLDSAIYPITIDPSFGYESKGGLSTTIENWVWGGRYECSSVGIAQSITAWIVSTYEHQARCRIYEVDETSDGNETGEETIKYKDEEEVTFTYVDGPDLAASTDYILAIFGNTGLGGTFKVYYDVVTASHAFKNGGLSYPTWPGEPVGFTTGTIFKISIYCTYEEEAVVVGPFPTHFVIP